MWRKFRIVVLLLILATVAQQSLLKDGAPKWDKTLYVALYPINADGSGVSAGAIQQLSASQFEEVASYLSEESAQYGLTLREPFAIRLGGVVSGLPPKPGKSLLEAMVWSLHFRFWAWQHSPKMLVKPDIRLYLLYHDPKVYTVLPHSTALQKGRLGMVNLFAGDDYVQQNNVVLAHELLHTVAATDKYNLQTNQPQFPDGYAEPYKDPLLPQRLAELMGGRVPISADRAVIPEHIRKTVIGKKTAYEIGWTNTWQ